MEVVDLKRCCRCREERGRSEFHKNRSAKDGLSPECKGCVTVQRKRQYARDAEKICAKTTAYYRANRPAMLQKLAEYKAPRRAEIAAKQRAYQKANRPTINAYKSKWQRARRASNANVRIRYLMSGRITAAVRKASTRKCGKTASLIGCTVAELRAHIEAQWKPGMSWGNHSLHGWHIDHIKPCAAFDLTDPEQQRACFHYTNLQPLWALDNLRKGGA